MVEEEPVLCSCDVVLLLVPGVTNLWLLQYLTFGCCSCTIHAKLKSKGKWVTGLMVDKFVLLPTGKRAGGETNASPGEESATDGGANATDGGGGANATEGVENAPNMA